MPDVGRALGVSVKVAARELKKNWYFTRHFRSGYKYDSRVIDVMHALRGEQARPFGHGETDWLAEFISGGEANDPTGPQGA